MRFFPRKNRRKNALVIINPVAGKMRSQKALFQIVDYLCRYEYMLTVQTTRGKMDAHDLAVEFGEGKDLVVCAGGDGTLNEVISGVMELCERPSIAYIPTGTTNDFASTLQIPKDIKKALKKIIVGSPTPLDIGRFGTERYFSYVASFGIFTEASYRAPQSAKNLLGHFAYVLEGIREITNLKTQHAIIKCDDTEIEGDFIFAAISNSRSIGGIMKLSDEKISLSDGMFEVLLVRAPQNAAELGEILNAVTTQKFDGNMTYMLRGQKICVHTSEAISWSLDGERADTDGDVAIECLHHAINVML